MKIVNVEQGNLDIFWTTLGISMKFSGKLWLMTIFKVTKKQCFTLSLKNIILVKPKGKGQIDPPAVLGLKNLDLENEHFTSFKELSLSVSYPL